MSEIVLNYIRLDKEWLLGVYISISIIINGSSE